MTTLQRTRTTLSLRQRENGGRRLTAKKARVSVQTGGAAWYAAFGDRKDVWKAAKLGDKTVGELFPLHFGDPAISDVEKPKMLEEHFQILEMQDELFDVALNLIRAKVKRDLSLGELTDDVIVAQSAAIDALKEECLKYIDDVEGLVNFKIDKTINDTNGRTKLQDVRSDTETLSTLLLFPTRLNNIFVRTLADILIVINTKPSLLNDFKTIGLRKIAVAQYESNIYGNAFLSTAKKLRDGFYLDQGAAQFSTEMEKNNFWEELFTDIGEPSTIKNLTTASWADLTKRFFFIYKSNKENLEPSVFLKKYLNDVEQITLKKPLDRASLPNEEYNTEQVRGDITYGDLLLKIDDETLQFILHLAYTIRTNQENTLKRLAEATAATPAGISPSE